MYRFFELLTEIVGWLLIAVSPCLIGLGIGAFGFIVHPAYNQLAVTLALGVFGLVIGAIWATKIYRKKGTIRFLSRISGTPDLDEKLKDENK